VAAYKAAALARRLVEAGAEVRCIMTETALEFLGPQTMAAITGRPPAVRWFGGETVSVHTELARWADVVVVAPATAATLSRIAVGLSDDLLVATILATRAPLVLAPAMHTEMWENPATRRNIEILRGDGHTVVGPAVGALAGGDEGPGRMVEPEEIVDVVIGLLADGPLAGRRVVVTAGGTREPIDPVRYIGNRSSGKMGAALAVEAARRGGAVTLVTTAAIALPGVEVVEVEAAQEMATAVWDRAGEADVVVLAAAVADFRPAAPAPGKLRRAEGPPQIELEPTPDILRGVAEMKPRPLLVGFAAETGPVADALEKGKQQRVDLLVVNDVTEAGSGFGTETNRVTLVRPDGSVEPWELMSKADVSARLWDVLQGMLEGGSP
ncbi:MAG TPA: bifunctional phosphopantothenoylcysteine decarboxylase/phosphopantothenate--cysteine ligase CoaBC, partial [Gemmatimonadales bacterium]|nr:bifunctional phosphopantothenoylcysteine decarboxylase/phosphopantothenate--cysteine ligase CoaBC [Gemmatimonadales bacterium]